MYYIAIVENIFIKYRRVSYNELKELENNNVKFWHVFNPGLLYFK